MNYDDDCLYEDKHMDTDIYDMLADEDTSDVDNTLAVCATARAGIEKAGFSVLETFTPGAEGFTFACIENKTRENVVIKAGQRGGTVTEAHILRNINHPVIIRLMGTFTYNSFTCLVLPRYKTDLYCYLSDRRRIAICDMLSIERSVLRAIQYLHENRIIHRDVKAENIFINHPGDVCLGDFGAACYPVDITQNKYYGWAGTIATNAPELLARDPYGPAVDIWSAGIVLFEMATCHDSLFEKDGLDGDCDSDRQIKLIIRRTGVHPSEFPIDAQATLDEIYRTCQKTSRKPGTRPTWTNLYELPLELEYLICKMLAFDAHKRPSAKALLDFAAFYDIPDPYPNPTN
ncbi:protein kinase [Cercopithecine alphaherpesvirus 9]|uniref:Serine/threonine-protein kinase US3 homolog n=3 Tax=Cercopithecine alphaherpesvirus 9 TaxID=35246 RepID=US03_CHV9D|nr:RecName: Full=Serine/threonine-protein kinase US3 homolog [Cercopithecine herpesvirus 9 (strain DHV)]AAA47887.1 serine/threonine protein kinase [Cercopithecine alphaherpesvirus 9]AAG27241.1 protein kinase [Cercopithecine alphaherpesvirus 9]